MGVRLMVWWVLPVVAFGLGCDQGKSSAVCEGNASVLDGGGGPTGFEQCEDGSVHRASAVAADPGLTGEACPFTSRDAEQRDNVRLDCLSDVDCDGSGRGQCVAHDFSDTEQGCACVYVCTQDRDCDTGQICLAQELLPEILTHATCVSAACLTDADCESGECGLSWSESCGAEGVKLACRTESDACRANADCGSYTCASHADGAPWTCKDTEGCGS